MFFKNSLKFYYLRFQTEFIKILKINTEKEKSIEDEKIKLKKT
jgi:hypothetical protein